MVRFRSYSVLYCKVDEPVDGRKRRMGVGSPIARFGCVCEETTYGYASRPNRNERMVLRSARRHHRTSEGRSGPRNEMKSRPSSQEQERRWERALRSTTLLIVLDCSTRTQSASTGQSWRSTR